MKVEEDNESAPSMKQETDKESKASSDSYLTSNSVSHPYTGKPHYYTLVADYPSFITYLNYSLFDI